MENQCSFKVTYNNTKVEVHSAYFKYKNDNVALIYIDLSEKRCALMYTGSGDNPLIGLEKPDSPGSMIEITFDGFDSNWNVFSCELCKYTVAVALYRIKDE